MPRRPSRSSLSGELSRSLELGSGSGAFSAVHLGRVVIAMEVAMARVETPSWMWNMWENMGKPMENPRETISFP